MEKDQLVIGGHAFDSRFILGSGKYSFELIDAAVKHAGAQIVTCAIRRTKPGEQNIMDYIPKDVTLLPNTSGSRTAEDAIRIAHMARELGCGDFVKLEVIPDTKYLLPDNGMTIEATKVLAKEGFIVMPYMFPDLNAAKALADAGAAAIMPLGAPIGSNQGLASKAFIQILIDEIDLPIIRRVEELAADHGVPMSCVALAWLYHRGVAAPIVRALVGHSTAAMTDRYTHVGEAALLQAFAKIS